MEDRGFDKLLGEGTRVMSKDKNVTYIDYGVEEGRAIIIMYDVFPGIKVLINDFCTDSSYKPVDKQEIIEINHCLRGRFECEFDNDSLYLERIERREWKKEEKQEWQD